MTIETRMGARRKWFAVFGILVLLAIAGLYFLVHREPPSVAPRFPPTDKPPSAFAKYLERSKAQSAQEQQLVERAAQAKDRGEVVKILSAAPRLLRAFLMAEASVHDIDFYGVVRDQHGEPVDGARVHFIAGGGLSGASGRHGFVRTGADGVFRIRARGDTLDLRHMLAQGFQIPLTGQPKFFKSFRDGDVPDFDGYGADHPATYQAWRIPEDMRPTSMVSYRLWGGRLSEGAPQAIDFFAPGNEMNKLKQDGTGGQLVMDFSPGPGAVETPQGLAVENWLLRISVREGGGLAPATGIFKGEAPESGYQESVELLGYYPESAEWNFGGYWRAPPPASERGRLRIGRGLQGFRWHWYIYLPTIRQYGRITVEFRPPDEMTKRAGFVVDYTFNPTGQRYLDTYGFEAEDPDGYH